MGRLLRQHGMVRRSRRGILAGGIVAAWGLAAGAPVAAAAPAPGLVSPPDLPPQPGVAAAPCRDDVPQPGAWTLIATQRNGTPSGDSSGNANFASLPAPGYQVTVDPQLPCRMYRATDARTLDRSLDGGRTWTQVFHDDRVSADAGIDPTCAGSVSACAATTQPFTISGISVLHSGVPGWLTLSERGNGDAAVMSADAGTTWQTAHGGVAGIANHQVDRIVTVSDGDPHHPAHALAVTEAPVPTQAIGSQRGQPQALYATTDGGATWTPSLLPAGSGSASTSPDTSLGIPAVVVEPQASGLAWAVAQGELQTTTDSGLSWSAVAPVPSGAVRQLAVLHPGARNQTLLLVVDQDTATDPVNTLLISGDNGISWQVVQLPPRVSADAVATTEYNGTILVAATETTAAGTHRRARFYLSRDGLRTMTEAAPPQQGYTETRITTPLTPVDGSTPPETILQSDTRGSFYVGITACQDERFTGSARATCQLRAQSFWRYTPPAQPARGTGVVTTPPAGGSVPVEATTELFDCQLSSAGYSSPLAFDGRDLIYPDPSPAQRPPLMDMIDIIDPQRCLTALPRAITVHFDAHDTVRACACTQVAIEQISYDPLRQQIWLGILGANAAIFTAPWPAPTAATTDIQAHLAFAGHRPNGCGGSGDGTGIAYDYSDDTLWTCDHNAAGQPIGDHIRAADGGTAPDPCYGGWSGWFPGSWTAGAPGRLFQWAEDDTTVNELDTATCATVRHYLHRPVVEPAKEDESLVCDPLTFTHIMGWAGPEATVFWLRESGLNQVIAFAAPSALCPLPTATTLLAPASVACGGGLALSATLRLRGPLTPLPGQSLDFRVDGRRVGMAVTDAGGTAQLTVAPLSVAGVHQVGVYFAGTSRLLASERVGGLVATTYCPQPAGTVQVPPVAVVRGGLLLPPLVPGGPPPLLQPQPGAQGVNAVQPEAQAQVQAQTQSQVQSQTTAQLQPGLMTQRQRQAQVATQTARSSRVSAALSATALRQPAAALLLCAVALAGGARARVVTAAPPSPRRRRHGKNRGPRGRGRRCTR